MGKFRGVYADSDPGWIKREHKALWKAIKESNAAKRLQAATIGRGGVTVKDGGSLTVEDGGRVIVKDGAGFAAEYADGAKGIDFGPTVTVIGDPTMALRLMDEDGEIIFGAHRVRPGDSATYPDGYRTVQVGDQDVPADGFDAFVGPGQFSMNTLGTITLDGGPSGGVKIGHSETAEAANCYISPGTGLISRSTSSRRYKTDITDAEIDTDTVLRLVPRAFRTKSEVDELGDAAPVRVGFIAEEAADLGLDAWVTFDDEGPEAFSYASYCVALQAVVRRQAEQIEALAARVDALEGNQQP